MNITQNRKGANHIVLSPSELEKVLTFQVASILDYRRVALESFRIAIELLSFFKTFGVALLTLYSGFSDSAPRSSKKFH